MLQTFYNVLTLQSLSDSMNFTRYPMAQKTTLTSHEFTQMMLTAASALSQISEYLNDINVFPVADGDTGLNMTATLSQLNSDISLFDNMDYATMSDKIMTSLMFNSQGNSGTALSQFFKGLLIPISQCDDLTTDVMKAAFVSAREHSWKAFSEPVKGTILDVIDGLADCGCPDSNTFEDYFAVLYDAADASLQNTKNVHPMLIKAHVVDSGAAGLTAIVKAWKQAIDSDFNDIPEEVFMNAGQGDKPDHAEYDDEYQFCTEIVVELTNTAGDDSIVQKIKDDIAELGGYVQVITYKNLLKIHIHTNQPEKFKDYMAQYGSEISFKADDMLAQQNDVSEAKTSTDSTMHKSQYVFITDSSADLSEGGISFTRVPLAVNTDSGEDLSEMEPELFYNRMAHSKDFVPKTAKAPEGKLIAAFNDVLDTSSDSRVVCIVISSKLSATHQAAKLAQESCKDPSRVIIVDSYTASAGVTLIVEELQQQVQSNWSAEQIQSAAQGIISRLKTYFVVDNMEYLKRSGRVSAPLNMIGQLLNLSPMLGLIGGKIEKAGSPVLFANTDKQVSKMKKVLAEESKGASPKRVFLVYAGSSMIPHMESIIEYGQTLGIAKDAFSIAPLSKAIGAHTGPASFGMFILRP